MSSQRRGVGIAHILFLQASLLTALLLTACGGGSSNGNPLAPIAPYSPVSATPMPVTQQAVTILQGSQQSYALSHQNMGNAVATSADTSVASVVVGQANTYTIVAVSPGTTQITIDQPGYGTTIITVRVIAPIVAYPSSLTLPPSGMTQAFSVSESGYTGTFSVKDNSAPTVATVVQNTPGTFTVTGVSSGTTIITVGDANGQTIAIPVTSLATLAVTPATLSFTNSGAPQNVVTFEANYSGQYTLLSNSVPGIVSVSPSGSGSFAVAAVSTGSTTLTFGDANGQTVAVPVNSVLPITLSPASIALNAANATQQFTASEAGYGGTFAVAGNSAPGVASVTQSSPGVFTVTALGSGSTTITIGDAYGTRQTVTVGVTLVNITINGVRRR